MAGEGRMGPEGDAGALNGGEDLLTGTDGRVGGKSAGVGSAGEGCAGGGGPGPGEGGSEWAPGEGSPEGVRGPGGPLRMKGQEPGGPEVQGCLDRPGGPGEGRAEVQGRVGGGAPGPGEGRLQGQDRAEGPGEARAGGGVPGPGDGGSEGAQGPGSVISSDSRDGELWGHRWGFRDTRFEMWDDGSVMVSGNRYPICGYAMPFFVPFVEECLGVPLDRVRRPEAARRPPPPMRNEAFVRAVDECFAGGLDFDDETRMLFSHGQTTADEVMQVLYQGTLERTADAVFHCREQQDVPGIIQLAGTHGVCLVPFGGGTSVSCALKLPVDEPRMIVVLDMRGLARIGPVDTVNMRVSVEAGVRGEALEHYLNSRGYTMGHEPDSIELSTVGGWIAANASGMKKNRYGNIEDLVENFTLVTPSGTVEMKQTQPRTSHGMPLQRALFGSEGTLGVITRAQMRIFRIPPVKRYQSVIFANAAAGISFIRELRDSGITPASVRLVDNLQLRFSRALRPRPRFPRTLISRLQNFILTRLKGFRLDEAAAATIVFEGSREETRMQESVVKALARNYNALFGGSANGRRGYMLTYAIAYIRDFLSDYYVLGETYETTVPWDRITELCDAVNREAARLHEHYGFPGKSYVSYRITQIYQTGVCIYFTHALCYRGIPNPEEKFAAVERALRRVILDKGGSLSHHHGIGKIRAGFITDIQNDTAGGAAAAVKKHLDPNNIFGIANHIFSRDASWRTPISPEPVSK